MYVLIYVCISLRLILKLGGLLLQTLVPWDNLELTHHRCTWQQFEVVHYRLSACKLYTLEQHNWELEACFTQTLWLCERHTPIVMESKRSPNTNHFGTKLYIDNTSIPCFKMVKTIYIYITILPLVRLQFKYTVYITIILAWNWV